MEKCGHGHQAWGAISRRKGAHRGMGAPAQHTRTQKKEKQTISTGIVKEERPVTFFT